MDKFAPLLGFIVAAEVAAKHTGAWADDSVVAAVFLIVILLLYCYCGNRIDQAKFDAADYLLLVKKIPWTHLLALQV
jgi:hypothetical protein